ncbi:peptidyl-prolyl cis-trans isomerase C [Hyphomicrobium sp. 1Nfss2.1]|uniref:peptidylprolyl isomerase n=1 Tax=Hyphomicrobium sp. 1Nfss2.1 TaxID=3413936 RepID=UPI003C7ACC5B
MYPAIPKKRALAGFAILAATLLSVPAPSAFAEDASDKVVVTVDGKPITEGEMKLAEGEVGQDLAQLPPEVKRRALAEYLIDNRLFANAAEAAKLGETPEFKKYMDYLHERALREQYFEKSLKESVTEEEAKKIYNARLAQMKPEPEFAARHILVASEEKAKELRAKIAAGEDFAKVAKENSIDPASKSEGGFLGYFGPGQMLPEFENVVIKMQKGELSEPVKTAYGWHIIKLEDRRTKAPPSFDQVKDTIMNSLAVRKAQEASAEMRSKAKVEYVDPDLKKLVEEQKKKQAEAMEAAKKAVEQGGAAAPGAAPGAAAPAAKP